MIPRQLAAIRRDWTQLAPSHLTPDQMSATAVRDLLVRLDSLKVRLMRCRNVRSRQAKSLRASLFRSIFSGWRATLKKLLRTQRHQNSTVAYIRGLIQASNPFNPSSWIIRLLALDSARFKAFIPELDAAAPVTAQGDPLDPYWRALKVNLSPAQL